MIVRRFRRIPFRSLGARLMALGRVRVNAYTPPTPPVTPPSWQEAARKPLVWKLPAGVEPLPEAEPALPAEPEIAPDLSALLTAHAERRALEGTPPEPSPQARPRQPRPVKPQAKPTRTRPAAPEKPTPPAIPRAARPALLEERAPRPVPAQAAETATPELAEFPEVLEAEAPPPAGDVDEALTADQDETPGWLLETRPHAAAPLTVEEAEKETPIAEARSEAEPEAAPEQRPVAESTPASPPVRRPARRPAARPNVQRRAQSPAPAGRPKRTVQPASEGPTHPKFLLESPPESPVDETSRPAPEVTISLRPPETAQRAEQTPREAPPQAPPTRPHVPPAERPPRVSAKPAEPHSAPPVRPHEPPDRPAEPRPDVYEALVAAGAVKPAPEPPEISTGERAKPVSRPPERSEQEMPTPIPPVQGRPETGLQRGQEQLRPSGAERAARAVEPESPVSHAPPDAPTTAPLRQPPSPEARRTARPARPTVTPRAEPAPVARPPETDLLTLLGMPADTPVTRLEAASAEQTEARKTPVSSGPESAPAPLTAVSRAAPERVSRQAAEAEPPPDEEERAPDIEKLAREVYSILRDRLRIERERSTGWR
jgi:hypothetical protein